MSLMEIYLFTSEYNPTLCILFLHFFIHTEVSQNIVEIGNK